MAQSFHAPGTRYAFERSRLLGWFVAIVLLFSGGGLGAWMALTAGNLRLQFVVSAVLWAGTAALAWHFWRCLPRGFLQWDGLNWSLNANDASPITGAMTVHMDFQRVLLVHLKGLDGRTVWLCLERVGQNESWAALRRAVYSRPKPELRADGVFPVRRGDA